MDKEPLKYLNIVDHLPLGSLRLAHFVTAAGNEPDFILRRDGGRDEENWLFEPSLGKVERPTREEVPAWPGHERGAPIEHFVALLDRDGHILLRGDLCEQEATKLMMHVLRWIEPFQSALQTIHSCTNGPLPRGLRVGPLSSILR